MPRRMLTDRFCASAKSGEAPQTDYFDEAVTGLALRVSRGGAKSWTFNFTWGGKRARMTFGTYPATSLATARSRAEEARGSLEAGSDPRSTLRKPDTLNAVCEEYFEREGERLRTGSFRRATLERLVYPRLGDRPIGEVRRSDVVRLLDAIENECGPAMADQTLAYLRRVFSWYASRSDDFRSPIVRGMARTKPRERARERTLSDAELRAIWIATDDASVFGRLVRFILLTAARRTEAAGMTRTELAGRDWTLSAGRNKTKVDLVRPLSPEAIGALPARGNRGEFVFSTDGGETSLSGFSKFKARLDTKLGDAVAPWRLHDLRRTARSLMSRAGVSSDHAERCLGHVIAGVRGTYDRHDFYAEKAAAYGALAGVIEGIVSNDQT